MRVVLVFVLGVVLWSSLLSDVQADDPHWRIIKKYIQKDVEVVEQTEDVIGLYHTTRQDTLWLGLRPCDTCDIVGFIEERRGSNPYRVWTANTQFWDNPDRPQSTWGKYFRGSFLRVLRPPVE